MMKKEMILPSSSVRSGQYAASRPSVFAALKGYCLRSKAVHSLSAFYSRLLETRVTPLQTLHLLHAQLSVKNSICTSGSPPVAVMPPS